MSIEETNKEVCIKFVTTSPPDSFDLLAEDLSWTIMGKESGSELIGPQTKAQFIGDLEKAGNVKGLSNRSEKIFPKGLRLKIHGVIAEGNKVAMEAESFADASNGKKYNNVYHYLFELRDGKIVTVREYTDTAHQIEVIKGRSWTSD